MASFLLWVKMLVRGSAVSGLNVRKVQSLIVPGMYGDGGGLYLRVGKSGGRSWILRTVVHGRRRDLGLGSAQLVTLAEARELAIEFRRISRSGGDPTASRKRLVLTFEQATREAHKNLLPSWRSDRHGEIWIASMERYVFPLIGERPVESIRSTDIMPILLPIWTKKNDTASRVKQRIATVFDWAKGAGHYPHENPVNGLNKALPAIRTNTVHMPALPWRQLPAFMEELKGREGVSARALEFIVLTAARSGEARGATWSEISQGVWTIPADRMKTGVSHRVPLSCEALLVLEKARGLDADLIFPSPSKKASNKGRSMSDPVFKALMMRMKVEGITTHGFRSTFRDWCSESARVDREVAEAALGHRLGNKVERAYARSDLFERRRQLMDAWGKFASGQSGAVVRMVR